MTEELRAHDALNQYLERNAVRNADLAERIQTLRRHPSIPSAAEISHWRSGRTVPQHDMRVWMDLATEGQVPCESWGEEKQERKMEQIQSSIPRAGFPFMVYHAGEDQRWYCNARGVRANMKYYKVRGKFTGVGTYGPLRVTLEGLLTGGEP